MLKDEVRRRITEIGIVPVVRASSPREALDAVEAVCKGGIRVVEITMTVPGAVEIIRELLKIPRAGRIGRRRDRAGRRERRAAALMPARNSSSAPVSI